MSKTEVRIVLGMLLAVHWLMALLFNPLGLFAGSGPLQTHATFAGIGALVGQPALLALWAALGTRASLRRWSQALAVLACLTLAHQAAEGLNAGRVREAGEAAEPVMWFVAFLVCQLPLWLLRRRFAWRIEPPAVFARGHCERENQFSLRGLLSAMAALAAYLAALRWPHLTTGTTQWSEHLLRFAAVGVMMGLSGMLAIVVCWLVLSQGPRNRWRRAIAIVGLLATVGAAAAVARFGSPCEVSELIFAILGTLSCAVGSLLVLRLCGYRLVRRSACEATEENAVPAPSSVPRRRFAIVVTAMMLLLAALAAFAPGRLSVWREMAVRLAWDESGLIPVFADGEVVQLLAIDGRCTHGDLATIDRINACDRLRRLELRGPTISDETLEELASLPSLTRLSLFGARVSDDGLRHLGKFPNLSDLDLRMTDVTDDGLVALASVRNLVVLDLGHTRVTPEGLAWLTRRRTNLRASAMPNDVTMRQIAQFFRTRQTQLSRTSEPGPAALRVRAAGPAVTRQGVAALRDMTCIEELDLTGANVTDAALIDLVTLTGLKRLVLSGTGISDSGIELLQRRLPECEVVR